MKKLILLGVVLLFLIGCNSDEDEGDGPLITASYFKEDTEGWIAEYADYEVGLEDSLKFEFKHGSYYINEEDGTISAALQTGFGTDGTLFMFIKQQVSGLEPGKRYDMFIATELLVFLNEEYTSVDLINDPTKGAFLKIGAFTNEPIVKEMTDPENTDKSIVVTEFDKGPVNGGSNQLLMIGKIEHSVQDEDPVVNLGDTSDRSLSVTADDDGKIWLLVGVDCNLALYQTIYYSLVFASFD